MADSDALRSRRKRLHAAGDHSLCRRCDAVRAATVVLAPGDGPDVTLPEDVPGSGPVDAQASLERQARRLETACEANPGNAALEKELRATLLALRGAGEAADSDISKFLAEFSNA